MKRLVVWVTLVVILLGLILFGLSDTVISIFDMSIPGVDRLLTVV